MKLSEVPKKGGKTELNSGNPDSRVDKFSGQHTTSILVALLFVLVLVGYILMNCLKNKVESEVNTGMISLMTLLIGFFSGRTSKKD